MPDVTSADAAWRQPGSVAARAGSAALLLAFSLLAVPPVAALWFASAPLRFVNALVMEPDTFAPLPQEW